MIILLAYRYVTVIEVPACRQAGFNRAKFLGLPARHGFDEGGSPESVVNKKLRKFAIFCLFYLSNLNFLFSNINLLFRQDSNFNVA